MPIAKTKSARARIKSDRSEESEGARDILMVGSVEKAFRVLSAFDEHHRTLSLTELADVIDLDRSATQRFAHTLTKLGYLAYVERLESDNGPRLVNLLCNVEVDLSGH